MPTPRLQQRHELGERLHEPPDRARRANAPDEIWVAAGRTADGTDRTITFAMKNAVGIYGGIAGTKETLRSERNPTINVTILSGDIGTPMSRTTTVTTSSRPAATVTASGVLDGFTITAGQADGSPAAFNDRGAGMWNNGGSPTLAQLTFSGNFAQGEGGALRVSGGAPIILSSTFQGNSVGFGGHGGGVYAGAGSSVTAQGCIFRSNSISSASTGGGGIESQRRPRHADQLHLRAEQPQRPAGLLVDGSVIDNWTFTANPAYGARVSLEQQQHDRQLDLLGQLDRAALPRRALHRLGDRHLQRHPGRRHRRHRATSTRIRSFSTRPRTCAPARPPRSSTRATTRRFPAA